jgi:hypothetical protein
MYLNSGDWIENLTALEYNQGAWTVYHYNQEHFVEETHTEADSCDLTNSELFDHLIQEFELLRN